MEVVKEGVKSDQVITLAGLTTDYKRATCARVRHQSKSGLLADPHWRTELTRHRCVGREKRAGADGDDDDDDCAGTHERVALEPWVVPKRAQRSVEASALSDAGGR